MLLIKMSKHVGFCVYRRSYLLCLPVNSVVTRHRPRRPTPALPYLLVVAFPMNSCCNAAPTAYCVTVFLLIVYDSITGYSK